MKKNYWMIVGTQALLLMTPGCLVGLHSIRGSGDVTSIEISEEGFSKLDLSHGCQATLTQAETYSVVVQIDDNLADYVKIEKNGSTLAIGMKPQNSYSRVSLEAHIAMPDIKDLELSGGSEAVITEFSLDRGFSAELSGGSEIKGEISSGDLNLSLSGGSEVNLRGAGGNAKIRGSGGSTFGLEGFETRNVDVDLSGGSTALVNLDGTLTGALSGGSTIYYTGNAVLGKISKSGGARIVKN